MNIQEMHLSVMQGVDKINAQVADSILSTELDRELNKAIQKFVTTRFQQNNTYRKGFEETQKRRDDLRTLVTEVYSVAQWKEELRNANQQGGFIGIDTWELPSNYMYLINLNAEIHRNINCTEIAWILVDQEPLYYFLMDLNDFVGQNQLGDSTEWIAAISMVEDPAVGAGGGWTANAWGWGNNNSWSATTIPAVFPDAGTVPGIGGNSFQVENNQEMSEGLVQDILENWDLVAPGTMSNIWWQEFQGLNYPGQFIVPIDFDTYGNLNWDMSLGPVTSLVGVTADNVQVVQSPLLFLGDTFGARRVFHGDVGMTHELYSCKLVQHDDIFPMIDDPFNKTKYSNPLAVMRGRWIDFYTDDKFLINRVKLTYLRHPNTVSLGLNVSCDLPLHTHEEIVILAVSSILETISDPRSATHQLQVDKME